MNSENSMRKGGKGKILRNIIILIAAIIIIIIITIISILPKLEPAFLRKGVEFAQQQVLATLPTVEGFNPVIHTHDPLEVESSFKALREALRIKSLMTPEFKHGVTNFMILFMHCFDDQAISTADQNIMVLSLDSLIRNELKVKYNDVAAGVAATLETKIADAKADLLRTLAYDSMAIFNDSVRLGMTGSATLELINLFYRSKSRNSGDQINPDSLKIAIKKIERFQIKNEFEAVTKSIFASSEFAGFPEKALFEENVAFLINKLRDLKYDYEPIKLTLRSFITLWRDQKAAPNFRAYDLTPLFEFTQAARKVATLK